MCSQGQAQRDGLVSARHVCDLGGPESSVVGADLPLIVLAPQWGLRTVPFNPPLTLTKELS